MPDKKVIPLLLLLLCFALLLCGCGAVTTADAQSYLDGNGDVSATENEESDDSQATATETEAATETKTPREADAEQNGSAVMNGNGNASQSAATTAQKQQSTTGKSAKNNSSGGTSSASAGSQNSNSSTAGKQCTVSIDCKTILNNMSSLNAAKTSLVPADGVILKTVTVTFQDGDSVLDVLKAVTREQGIHLDFSESPAYGGAYVKGIGNLYEKDCGDLSGWEFNVNGWYPNYCCSNYIVSAGDVIQWRYTCNVGRDL